MTTEAPPKLRYRAQIAYDGSAWSGWQSQRGAASTVQHALEDALSTVLGEAVRVAGAGRTDAGVHARGQVVAFDVMGPLSQPAKVERKVNALLGGSAVLRELLPAAADFDPRHDACSRVYRYRLLNAAVLDPFERGRVWHVRDPLDRAAMSSAAAELVGSHDFGSFQSADNVARPSVRLVSESIFEPASGALLVYRVKANAFCRGMVRNLVGTLVDVGRGRLSLEGFRDLFAACDRARAPKGAPPGGLFLEQVNYP